ncbi:Ul36-like domain-containing protein [Pandoravirus kuranda]|uniref:Ul36-like domain-containing protein n=1 Tax=Pandoravirus kuranda TaxID=3019033 RepID=A0AA95J204_9VIRU|nr:Ul36-like domain-containing protein [Pandoravirus kuranda]
MQRDLYLPRLVADTGDQVPMAVLVDLPYGVDDVYYAQGRVVDQPTFDRLVPPERRATILNTATNVSTVYDVVELVDLIEDVDEGEDEGYGEPQWTVTQPTPRVEISDDDQTRILERARAAAATQPSKSVPEPEITTSVVDPTPQCQILPRGSAYDEVYDFTDFDVSRDEFERDVPAPRRAVIRSGASTTAYDAKQLVRAAKGVIGNSRKPPSRRIYVLSTRTGSCTLDRKGYIDLWQRSRATGVEQGPPPVATTTTSTMATPTEPVRAQQPALTFYQPRRQPSLQQNRIISAADVYSRPPFTGQPAPPLTRAGPPVSQATPLSRMGPSLGMRAPLIPAAGGVGVEAIGRTQAPRPLLIAGPSAAVPAQTNQRIRDAVSGARDGALVRLLGSPDFAQVMAGSLAIDTLADALVRDIVARRASGASDIALPIVLTSLGVRSYNMPALAETFDAALLNALGEADALGLVDTLRRAGFAPSDNAIIRSVVYRLSPPRGDTQTAMRILGEAPMSNLLNYRRVLAAAARVGSLPVTRYIVESILRDAPLSTNDALELANIAAGANQRAIQSLFLSLAQPAPPVPVSADYREREREYRGTF